MARMKKTAKDHSEIQARLLASQAKPVKLRIAASVVHNELTRQGRFAMRGPEYITALTQAAQQLAQVVDIYHVVNGRLVRIPEEELVNGAFEDGGNIFRTHSGNIYKALSVRRIDVLEGIEVLRQAHKAMKDASAAADQALTEASAEAPAQAPRDKDD